MGIQSNINSGISTLSYILSLGSKFKKQDNKISETEKGVKENKEGIEENKKELDEQAADIIETKAGVGTEDVKSTLTKKPFDPFDKYIAEFKSKLSEDEIALLDAQESRKPGSTRNLVDNYIRGKIQHEKNALSFRNRAESLMTNATQEELNDPKFMERINRYERMGTQPYRTQSQFLADADRQSFFDTPEERVNKWNKMDNGRPITPEQQRIKAERERQRLANETASDRLKMNVENKMKQETLKEERRNILQSMNKDLNNTPRGDM